MKETMKNIIKVLLTCFVSIMAVNVNAALINGSLGVGGVYVATGSDLSNVSAISITDVGANFGTGDIAFTTGAGVGGVSVSLTSFDPVSNFISIDGWNLDLATLNIDDRTSSTLDLSGTGILSGSGFDPTNVTWTFSAQSLTSYSMTATTVVPVPAAAWLFGSGLIGLAGIARRKV